MDVPLLDLVSEYRLLKEPIDAAVLGVLASGRFNRGPDTTALEADIAAWCGARHGIAVASGTDALALSLAALDVRPGDEIITTPFTFFAPSEVALARGARPVYVDIEPRTFCLDPAGVEAAITPRTVGILPVHLYGHPADLTALNALAERHHLWLIEDAAQAIGAHHAGRPVGGFGAAGALSFYPTKNLGAYGEGGMIVAQDAAMAEKLRQLRDHGSSRYSHHEMVGFNSRMHEIQAAILRVKLAYLEEWTEARRRNAALYSRLLEGSAAQAPVELPGDRHVYHQFTIRAADRDALQSWLGQRGIESRVYYAEPLHLQPVLAGHGYRPGQFPETERACAEVLSLPVHPQLTEAQVRHVAESILRCGQDAERSGGGPTHSPAPSSPRSATTA
jgi:dTDP-4-amino-4,6-dideoxygalactose transaminase